MTYHSLMNSFCLAQISPFLFFMVWSFGSVYRSLLALEFVLCSFLLDDFAVLWHWMGLKSWLKDESTLGYLFSYFKGRKWRSWCGNDLWITCYCAIERYASSLTMRFLAGFYQGQLGIAYHFTSQSILTGLPVPAAAMYSHTCKLHTLCGQCDLISVQRLICPNVKRPSVIRRTTLMASDGKAKFSELSGTGICFSLSPIYLFLHMYETHSGLISGDSVNMGNYHANLLICQFSVMHETSCGEQGLDFC